MELIGGGRVVTPDGVLADGWIEVSDGAITAIGAGRPARALDLDVNGGWVVPGFVDMHTHGGGGATVVGAEPMQVREFIEAHRAHGTTSIVASLVSGYTADLERDVRTLADLTDEGLIVGSHLEGPWISPERKGAHNPDALAVPEPADVKRLLAAGRGTIRMVTLAPELDHGIDAVRVVVASGAIAAIGHTDASYDTAKEAIEAGATVATHLFNAMAPIHHREPGPIVACLEDERVSVELVCDGVHLDAAVASFVKRYAGSARTVLVTDAMSAASRDDGRYMLGGLEVTVEDGVARLVESGTIAGSTLTMDRALAFAVKQAGFSMVEAVAAASTNPARLLGIGDRTGALAVGLDADIVVLDSDLSLRSVMARGAWSGPPDTAGGGK